MFVYFDADGHQTVVSTDPNLNYPTRRDVPPGATADAEFGLGPPGHVTWVPSVPASRDVSDDVASIVAQLEARVVKLEAKAAKDGGP